MPSQAKLGHRTSANTGHGDGAAEENREAEEKDEYEEEEGHEDGPPRPHARQLAEVEKVLASSTDTEEREIREEQEKEDWDGNEKPGDKDEQNEGKVGEADVPGSTDESRSPNDLRICRNAPSSPSSPISLAHLDPSSSSPSVFCPLLLCPLRMHGFPSPAFPSLFQSLECVP